MIIDCDIHGTIVEYNRKSCGKCADEQYRAEHGGVDRVTDFLYPGLKSFLREHEA